MKERKVVNEVFMKNLILFLCYYLLRISKEYYLCSFFIVSFIRYEYYLDVDNINKVLILKF